MTDTSAITDYVAGFVTGTRSSNIPKDVAGLIRRVPIRHEDVMLEPVVECFALLAAGRLKPVVHAVLPLADVAEGHRLIEGRAAFGKIVLRV